MGGAGEPKMARGRGCDASSPAFLAGEEAMEIGLAGWPRGRYFHGQKEHDR